MKNIGSLYQFIQPPMSIQLNKKRITNNSNSSLEPISKSSQNKSRMKTSLENYEASKKKLRIMSIQDDTNDSFMEADTWKGLTQKYRMNKYNQPVNSIMLPKKTQIIQLQKKNRLNMDQGLLRALEKVRLDEEKGVTQRGQHDSALSRYSETLSKLKLLPLQNLSSRKTEQQKNISQFYKVRKSRQKKSLSDTKRIEFEKNLSWAKKHHKDGNYYEMKLGKIKAKEDWSKQVRKRKDMLSAIGEKFLYSGEDRRHSVI